MNAPNNNRPTLLTNPCRWLRLRWAALLVLIEMHQPLIELIVMVVLAWTLYATNQTNRLAIHANQVSKEALESAFIPWIGITKVNLSEHPQISPGSTDSNYFAYAQKGDHAVPTFLDITVKNFAAAPAFQLSIDYACVSQSGRMFWGSPQGLYVSMPGYEDTLVLPLPKNDQAIVQDILNRNAALIIELQYVDRFNSRYSTLFVYSASGTNDFYQNVCQVLELKSTDKSKDFALNRNPQPSPNKVTVVSPTNQAFYTSCTNGITYLKDCLNQLPP